MEKSNLIPEVIDKGYELFTALHEKTRRRIIYYLDEVGECKMNELMVFLEREDASISYHLRTLNENKIIKKRQEGRDFYYSLNYGTLYRIHKWMPKMWEEISEVEK